MQISKEIDKQHSQSFKNIIDNGKPPKSGVVINSSTNQIKHIDPDPNVLENFTSDSNTISKFDSVDFGVTKIKVITICKFLAHLSMSKEISLVCHLTEEFVEKIAHMISLTIQIFNEVSISKHAKDCADVLLDVWISMISDIANIKTDISDWRKHKYSDKYYQFQCNSTNSSEIMKKYKLFHKSNRTNSTVDANIFSAPVSPSVTMPKSNNLIKFNVEKNTLKTNPNNSIYSTLSMNSLIQEKNNLKSDFLNKKDYESPNPWLSINEIERIIAMKGQVVIDLASQITMFSHNEGPLKTSVDLMNTTYHLVRELANFHAFAERNLLSNHILSDLDKFPSFISTICSIQNQNTTDRPALFTKIDKIVELVRCTATLVTNVIANWRSPPLENLRQNTNELFSTSNKRSISNSTAVFMKNRFNFDEIPDNKSCFSDTTNNFLLQKPRLSLTRSSSVGRKLDFDPFAN